MENLTIEKIEKAFQYESYFDSVYIDTENENGYNFEDDNILHFCRNGFRIIFYNGQEKGRLREKDLKKYSKIVDEILKTIE